jgi:hypothetical protein
MTWSSSNLVFELSSNEMFLAARNSMIADGLIANFLANCPSLIAREFPF